MTVEEQLEKLLAVKGVTAAAIVSSGGELVAGRAADPAVIDRLVMLQTAALAAGKALGELIPPAKRAADEDADLADLSPQEERPSGGQLMAIYPEGPVLFVPLPAVDGMCVVALSSPQDVGRARFALRGLVPTLAETLTKE
ncbi:MAG: hypothetical protein KF813_14845 [Trueperaceae bacterium]|nr:hypothetical protein [Trueperaceae bacterium]